jgi:hypothetical protein
MLGFFYKMAALFLFHSEEWKNTGLRQKKKKSTLKKGTYNTASEENIRGLEEV